MSAASHQRAGLALGRHQDGHGAHAGQRGGSHRLRGRRDEWRQQRRRHLRLGPVSPAGDCDRRGAVDLRGAAVGAGRPLVFARRSAAHVVAGEPLQGVGLAGPQLVGVDDGAVRRRRGRVGVVEVGLVGVSGPRAGGDGGQRAVLGHHVRTRVALGP